MGFRRLSGLGGGGLGNQVVVFIDSVFNPKGVQQAERAISSLTKKTRDSGKEFSGSFLGKDFSVRATEEGMVGRLGAREFSATTAQMAMAAGAATGAVALLAVGVKKYYEISKQGAENRQLEESFNRFVNSVGSSNLVLDEMISKTDSTMSRLSAMEGVMTLVAGMTERTGAAFVEATPALAEIAKAANKLNPTLGDTNFMFNSLARGIKRSEVRLLDNLGLNIKVADANRVYAAEIGKTVKALSAEDKQMALLNETLRVGQLLIEQVGGTTDAQVDSFLRLTAAWQNYRNEVIMSIGASDFPVIGGITNFLEGAEEATRAERLLDTARSEGIISAELYNKLDEQRWLGQLTARQVLLNLTAAQKLHNAEIAEGLRIQEKTKALGIPGDPNILIPPTPPPPSAGGQPTSFSQVHLKALWAANKAAKEAEQERIDDMSDATRVIVEEGRERYAALLDLEQSAASHNAAIWEQYQADVAENLTATGTAMRHIAEEDNSLFTRSIDDIGEAYVTVGGRTKEQQELLEDFRTVAERTDDTVRDYTTGLRGYGMEQDKINEKVGEAAGALEFYNQKIADLEGIQGKSVKVTRDAVWDTEKMEEALLDANEAAGASAEIWADMKVAVGDWNEEQATAALLGGSMQAKIEQIAKAGGPANEQLAEMVEWMEFLDDVDLSNLFTPIEDLAKNLRTEDIAGGALAALEGSPLARDFFGEAGLPLALELTPSAEQRAAAESDTLMEMLYPGIEEPGTKIFEVDVDDLSKAAVEAEFDELTATETKLIQVVASSPDTADTIGQTPGGGGQASGGRVFAGNMYRVGEFGAEWFVPNKDGNIVTDEQMGAGGGDTYNYHYYNAAAAAIGRAEQEMIRRRGGR